jgi:hypothetical protein
MTRCIKRKLHGKIKISFLLHYDREKGYLFDTMEEFTKKHTYLIHDISTSYDPKTGERRVFVTRSPYSKFKNKEYNQDIC